MSEKLLPPLTRRNFLLTAASAAMAPALAASPARAAERLIEDGVLAAGLNVRSCGASGNGHDLDTAAINQAIATVAAKGGGIVRIPAGDYLCHTLHLQDGITLHLDRGATLRAAPAGQYDFAQPNRWEQYQDYGHNHWHNSLICGAGVKDIAIEGPGLICGDGLSRGEVSYASARRGGADKIIALKECKNVRIAGLSLIGSPHIAILATGVAGLKVSRLIVDTGRDGIDIDCCEDVVVEDSWFNTPHDDSIVLKSSNALGYRRPTTNVRIRRCLVTGGFVPGTLYDGRRLPIDAASGMKARIKIGTESCWGFDGVSIDSCAIWNALGIALLTVDGGALKNVALRDIGMRNIQDAPLFMRLGARLRAPAGAAVEAFAGITVERLACNGFGQPLTISGIPGHPITNIALRNIELTAHQGASNAAAGGWMPVGEAPLPPGNVPPEKASDYPEAGMFGALPAQFVFARHVDGLEIDGLRLKQIGADHSMPSAATATAGDSRPLFWFADVQGGRFAGIEVPPGTAEPVCVSDSACTLSPATTDERARVN